MPLRVKLNSLKGPASKKTRKPLQSPRKEREGGDWQPQVDLFKLPPGAGKGPRGGTSGRMGGNTG